MTHPTRRQFLDSAAGVVTLAGLGTLVSSAPTFAADPTAAKTASSPTSGDKVVFLNDTHIGEQHGAGHAHPENLKNAVQSILALPEKPAAVIINGDLAMSVGTPGDYKALAKLITPLMESGQNLHLTLGNHDNREVFRREFPNVGSASSLKDYRHNGLIELPNVRLVLLDSLKNTPAAPGRLGEEQIAWMLDTIDAQPNKPAVVVAHHNPQLGGDPIHYPGGIEDTDLFWPELLKRPQFKAHIHGHVHDWTLGLNQGTHIINLMASAMVADKSVCTNGWTMAEFRPQGVSLTLHTYLKDHPWSDERKWLFWRQPKPSAKR